MRGYSGGGPGIIWYRHTELIGGATPYYMAGETNIIDNTHAAGEFACTVDLLHGIPEYIASPVKVSSLGCAVILNGAANSLVRVGIYRATSRTNLYPSTLVAGSDAGELALNGLWSTNVFATPITLTPGLYWFTLVCGAQANANATRCRAPRCSQMAPLYGHWGAAAANTIYAGRYMEVAYAYAALPATYPAGGSLFNTADQAPGIFYSCSA